MAGASEMDWATYLVGGATRPDAMSGLADPFESSLAAMFASAPPEIQANLRLTSGFRSPEVQARLWEEALAKYGSPEAARKWVAPPGKSQHNHGSAADFKFLSPEAQQWAHDSAAQYGLTFPLSNEPWHVEPIGARSGGTYAASAAPSTGPQNGYQQQYGQTASFAGYPQEYGQPAPQNALAAFKPADLSQDPRAFMTQRNSLVQPLVAQRFQNNLRSA